MHKQHPQTAYRKYAVSIGTIFENCDKKWAVPVGTAHFCILLCRVLVLVFEGDDLLHTGIELLEDLDRTFLSDLVDAL